MLGILIQISILAGLMYAFARHEADISWPKLFLVFVPLIITFSMLVMVFGPLAYLGFVACMIVALKLWFYLDWGKAALISVVHAVVGIGLSIGVKVLTS